MKLKSTSVLVAILLASCGGGGDDSPGVAVGAPPPAAAPPPTTPPPLVQTPAPSPVAVAPSPVVPPVNPPPAAPPFVDPNPPAANPPPAQPPAPPEPAEGTFILGKILKAAMASSPGNTYVLAYEDGNRTKDAVFIGYYLQASYFSHFSYPEKSYQQTSGKYPSASVIFPVNYTSGELRLGQQITVHSGGGDIPLVGTAEFEIRDSSKVMLNQTSFEWKGVNGAPWFVGFQVNEYAQSNTVFRLCLHQSFPDVRRLACTIHNKDTGAYRGTQVLDDSRNLGVIEYYPDPS
jgi:hypothetical protein